MRTRNRPPMHCQHPTSLFSVRTGGSTCAVRIIHQITPCCIVINEMSVLHTGEVGAGIHIATRNGIIVGALRPGVDFAMSYEGGLRLPPGTSGRLFTGRAKRGTSGLTKPRFCDTIYAISNSYDNCAEGTYPLCLAASLLSFPLACSLLGAVSVWEDNALRGSVER